MTTTMTNDLAQLFYDLLNTQNEEKNILYAIFSNEINYKFAFKDDYYKKYGMEWHFKKTHNNCIKVLFTNIHSYFWNDICDFNEKKQELIIFECDIYREPLITLQYIGHLFNDDKYLYNIIKIKGHLKPPSNNTIIYYEKYNPMLL
jgi:hypothetical protein